LPYDKEISGTKVRSAKKKNIDALIGNVYFETGITITFMPARSLTRYTHALLAKFLPVIVPVSFNAGNPIRSLKRFMECKMIQFIGKLTGCCVEPTTDAQFSLLTI
jgi:hypothetical protein